MIRGIKQGASMPMVEVRGAGIYCEIEGNGPPLVLTTGQGTGPQARAELIAGLARQFRVLSYDQRGSGRSEPVPQGQSMDELADDIAALMDAAGFDRAHVIGHSTGTGKATCFAVRHSHRTEKLVLAAPWTHTDPDLQVLQDLRKVAARTMPPGHYVHFNALLIYPPQYRQTHFARFQEMANKAESHPQDPVGIAARLDSILALDCRPLYAQIRCPTLVMGALDDLVMPAWHAEEAAKRIADSRLIVWPHGGHMFPETRTRDFLAAVLPFLA
jgi:pimeloyl-ACP methyl ester carboxylesterase